MEPISRDDAVKDFLRSELTAALSTALQPLLEEMKEMRGDIKKLELTAAPRTDVYTKDVMDEKLDALDTGIQGINKSLAENREFTWKVVGAGFSLAMLILYLSPHLLWRP